MTAAGGIVLIAGIAGLVLLAAHKPSLGNELNGGWVFKPAVYNGLTIVAWALIVLGALNAINGIIRQVRTPHPAEEDVSQSGVVAGWYQDPSGTYRLRWWDGSQWTEHVQAAQESQSPPGAPVTPVPIHNPATPEDSGRRGRIAVAIAATILVGAIAATFLLLSDGSSSDQQRASDAKAKENAHAAQVALEMYATERGGSYAGATVAALQGIESTLPVDPELTTTEDSYTLTIPSEGSNSFTISNDQGALSYTCEVEGVGGCPLSGEW